LCDFKFCAKLIPLSFPLSSDISYSESWWRRVWNTPHHPSSWDRAWYGPPGGGLTFPQATWPPQLSAGVIHPTVPTPELGAALDHHLQKHDGAGRTTQQWTSRGKCLVICLGILKIVLFTDVEGNFIQRQQIPQNKFPHRHSLAVTLRF